jgi:DNA-binding ferritin-like protein
MTVPADGIARLMHFVDARLGQLRMSKEDANRRGFPHPSTLAAVRARDSQHTPTVRTLLRIDRTLGWQPGSAAVVLLGGTPLSVTARTTRNVRAHEQSSTPMTAQDVIDRLLGQLHDEIERARNDVRAADDRLQRLYTVHERLSQEFRVDHTLVEEFDDHDAVTGTAQH